MSHRKFLIAAAALALMTLGQRTEAAFTYSAVVSSPASSTITFGGSTLTFGSSSGTMLGTGSISTLGLSLATGVATDTLAATPFTIAITIVNGGFTGTLSFTETIAGSANLSGATFDITMVSYSSPASITLGGSTFSLFAGNIGAQDVLFNAPTPGSPGGFTPRINVSSAPSVPEPASIAMVAMGLGGLAVFARRRRTAA